MFSPGVIKVAASVGKGLTIVAKGHTARIVAVAAAVGVVTISFAIAAGMYITIRSVGSHFRKALPQSSNPSRRLLQ
jgi:hypothetical protein